jgi:hypothetical protein
MKKFGEYLEESLAAEIKTEPKTAASKEARKLGLTYMGFGRYADNKGRLAYVVHDDRLVPYKSRDDLDDMYYKVSSSTPFTAKKSLAVNQKPDKASQLKQEFDFHDKVFKNRQKEDNKVLSQKNKEAQALSNELYKFYNPNMFDENEVRALEEYTSEAFEDINRYLYKGHDEGVTGDKDQYLNFLISSLDSAFEDTQAPFAYTVYSGLSARYKPEKIQPGGEYIFRGYLSTSISYGTAIDSFADTDFSDKAVVLQIEISKGQKSIYVDPLSTHQGEGETLLPRGSRIKVISGPHIIDSSIVSNGEGESQIYLFHCQLMEDL